MTQDDCSVQMTGFFPENFYNYGLYERRKLRAVVEQQRITS